MNFKKGDKVRIKPEFINFYFKKANSCTGKIACEQSMKAKALGKIGFKRHGHKVGVTYVRVEHLEKA